MGKISVPTIFFGGGTPSLLPTDIFAKIMKVINSVFNVSDDCEITLEANPATLSEKRLDEFIKFGVNRLSIGIQSLSDEKLRFLGRRHSARDALDLLKIAQKKNIKVSADFIYGLPGETAKDVALLCEKINDLGLTHCSLYELTIEPATPFGKMNLKMPSNNEMAKMYNAIDKNLNLPRYEVSNYALSGFECRHNQNVWDGGAYIGIGRGAAGRIFFGGDWYEELGGGVRFEKMSKKTRAIEKIITGLRTMRGIKLDQEIKKVINMDYVRKHPNLIHATKDGRLAATKNGILILDNLLLNVVKI